MSLLKELQERRTHVLEELRRVEDLRAELADFDRAIAAIEPADPGAVAIAAYIEAENAAIPEPETHSGDDDPKEFEDFETDDASEFAADDTQAPALADPPSELRSVPGTEEEVRDQFEEERERAAAIELTADVEPPIQALIESGEHSYDEVAAIAYPEPQWNEPQTEGYAPVVDHTEAHIQAVEAERYAQPTNPEADAIARAHDWYDPKAVAERNKFNPWGGVSHLFGKPKVDA